MPASAHPIFTVLALVSLQLGCGDKETPSSSQDSGSDGGGATGADDTDTGDTHTGDTDDTGEDCPDPQTWYYDADGDGFGDDGLTWEGCTAPVAYVQQAGDCDDLAPGVNPDSDEVCNGVDDDCDGQVDPEGTEGLESWYADEDGDGYGDAAVEAIACEAPSAYVDNTGDCDDTEPLAWTGAEEICGDGVDNDCSGDAPGCELVEGGALSSTAVYLPGPDTFEGNGLRVASLGDISGDGVGDLAVSAPFWSAYDGRIFVAQGPITADRDLDSVPIVLTMEDTTGTDPLLGWWVDGAGDHDGDGYNELLAAAPGFHGTSHYGSAWLFGGPLTGATTTADAHMITSSDTDNHVGYGMSAATDLTGDGVPDILVGSPHYATAPEDIYLLAGPVTADADLDTDALRIDTDPGLRNLGIVFASEDDLTGDGLADLAVGAPTCDETGTDIGRVYLFEGPITADGHLDDAALVLDDLVGTTYFGARLATGDLDGDGQGDLAVGAYVDSGAASYAGATYVFSGPLASDLTVDDADFHVQGDTASQYLGQGLVVGDLDGDGVDDLGVGAPANGSVTPRVLVFFGGGLSGSASPSSTDRDWWSTDTSTQAGYDLDLAEDLTGDAAPDLIIGSSGSPATVGGAWVVPGGGM